MLVQINPGQSAENVAEPIRRWKHLEAFTRAQMEEILVDKLIATSAKQIGMFLVILAIVSAAIVAFIIYTMTLGNHPGRDPWDNVSAVITALVGDPLLQSYRE